MLPDPPALAGEPLDKDDRAFVLATLREEAMELFRQQRAIADKGARALGLGATVLIGFAAYGIASKATGHELLLRALPSAVALIGIELIQNFIAEGAMARARLAIEDALAKDVGVTVLVYDRHVRFRKGVTSLAVVVSAMFYLLYLGLVVLTQVPGAPDGIDGAGAIVTFARIATAVTGATLLLVIRRIYVEEVRGGALLTIDVPGRSEASDA